MGQQNVLLGLNDQEVAGLHHILTVVEQDLDGAPADLATVLRERLERAVTPDWATIAQYAGVRNGGEA